MVFFYASLHAAGAEDRERDVGYRNCFGLNFSAPMGAVKEVGGFQFFPFTYGYDDIELAFKLQRRFGMPVLFRPEAVAVHDHRYFARDILRREYQLGRAAWLFARENPEFGLAVFGRDITIPQEISYSREHLERERVHATRLEDGFLLLDDLPAGAVDGEYAPQLIMLIYQQHVALKRYVWRQGLVAAAAGGPAAYEPLVSRRCGSEDGRTRAISSFSRGPISPPILSRP